MQPTFREIQPQTYPFCHTNSNYLNDSKPAVENMTFKILQSNLSDNHNIQFNPSKEVLTDANVSHALRNNDKQASQKPKRKQVKNACVNCQKACKKCDDGRPCNRCIKLGLTATCRDSDRKERKKGVKRGPYKKRQAPVRKSKSASSMSSADEQQLDDAHTTQAQAVNVCPLTYQYTTTDISDSHAHFHNTSSVSKNHNQMANEALTIDLRDSICYPQGNSSIPTASASSSSLSLSTASSLLPSPIISNISLDLSESDETLHYAYGYTAPTTAATSSNNQHRCNLSSTTASTTSKMLEHQTISGNVTPSINANYQQFYSQESDFHYLQQGSIYDIQQPYQCLNMTDNFAVFINNENNGNPFQIEKCVRQQFLPDAQNVDGNFTTNMMLLDSNTYTIEQQQATKNEFTAIYYNSNTKIPTATTTLLLQQQYDNTIW